MEEGETEMTLGKHHVQCIQKCHILFQSSEVLSGDS